MQRKRKLDISEPRPVNHDGQAAETVMPATSNPYNGQPYSDRYFEILEGRKGMYLDYTFTLSIEGFTP